MKENLEKAGVKISSSKDTLSLSGGNIAASSLFKTHHDHRMVMCFAPIALNTPVQLDEIDSVKKSYPGFFEQLAAAGFEIKSVTDRKVQQS